MHIAKPPEKDYAELLKKPYDPFVLWMQFQDMRDKTAYPHTVGVGGFNRYLYPNSNDELNPSAFIALGEGYIKHLCETYDSQPEDWMVWLVNGFQQGYRIIKRSGTREFKFEEKVKTNWRPMQPYWTHKGGPSQPTLHPDSLGVRWGTDHPNITLVE
jgi:hypothetical protein